MMQSMTTSSMENTPQNNDDVVLTGLHCRKKCHAIIIGAYTVQVA